MVSVNTVLRSRPETKVLEQTLCATTPVATRMARSGRRMMPAATGTASTAATATHFRQPTDLPHFKPAGASRANALPRLLRRANRGQRLHGDAARRHIVVA